MTIRLVYILGSGHCGSTLLNMLLNSHSQVLGLSELERIGFLMREEDQRPHLNPLNLPFWNQVKDRYETKLGEPFINIQIRHDRSTAKYLDKVAFQEWEKQNVALFESVAEVSGLDVLVDSSKGSTRLFMLHKTSLAKNIKVIHLVRDGRAVMNSYMKRSRTFGGAFHSWSRPALYAFPLRRRYGKENWLQVQYEHLASDPESTLHQICEFIGVEYEANMLHFRDHEHVGIGGNGMARRDEREIRLDEKWRREFPLKHRIRFAIVGGLLNKYYGY